MFVMLVMNLKLFVKNHQDVIAYNCNVLCNVLQNKTLNK